MKSLSRRTNTLLSVVALVAIAGLVYACAKRIGDACTTNIDCSLNADRQCDTTQSLGYCTIPGCDPNRCPDQALCVEFSASTSRLARRFCMQSCTTNLDCRTGYRCAQPLVQADGGCEQVEDGSAAAPAECSRVLDDGGVRVVGRTGYCVQN